MEVKVKIGDFEVIYTTSGNVWLKREGEQQVMLIPAVFERLLKEYYENTIGL